MSDTSGSTGDDDTLGRGSDDTTELEVGEDTTELEVGASTDPQQQEIEALRAQLAELQAQVGDSGRPSRHRLRGFTAVVGVVVSCLLVAGAVLGLWTSRSFLDTDGFVERAGSVIEDPEVRGALSGWLTTEVNQLIDAEEVIAEALPDEARILAAPLGGAVNDFVGNQVRAVVDSDVFAELWTGAVKVAHEAAAAVLAGDSELVDAQQDGIVISLLPVINEVLAQITSLSPEIFGETVDLPDVTVEDVPEEAAQAIGDALGVDLDEGFGTFVVYDDGSLSAAQRAVELIDNLVWLFVIAAPLAIAGTLWVSPRRRRTLLQLTVGLALTMVVLRRVVLVFQDELLDLVQRQENVGAVDAISSTFLDPLLDGARWIGVIALVIGAVAAVSGPYPWAVSLRDWVARFARGAAAAVSDRSEDADTLVWVAGHREALQLGGIVVGVLLLWVLEVSWLGFLVLAALVGAYEFAVSRLADRGDAVGGGGEDAAGDAAPDLEPAADTPAG
jgi:hypothetical protein